MIQIPKNKIGKAITVGMIGFSAGCLGAMVNVLFLNISPLGCFLLLCLSLVILDVFITKEAI